ncbi:MAG: fumarate hydratase [Eubacteriales bacterium]|nr:fumarate hydratase [Eubacteriales bacterium]
MKTIKAERVIETVEDLCIKANCSLNSDIIEAISEAIKNEESPAGREALKQIKTNSEIAFFEQMPMCQDTGMTVVFAEIGQDIRIIGGDLGDAINEGVRRGYLKGYLRKSVVDDPILRTNTGDNTPAVIHYEIVAGENLKLTVAPKGFGSENMSAIKMLKPSDGLAGIKEFVVETVDKAGSNPCPPVIVGVGIGGTMEKAALIAKKALLRPIDIRNGKRHIRELEELLLKMINGLGIGPAGIGGSNTALAVNIEVYPTHIAGLPVAVNISCHATRHAEAFL